MDVNKVVVNYRLSQWAAIVKKRIESGTTINHFCEENGLSKNSYFYWQRKLRETAYEALATTKNEETNLIPYGFTEVRLSKPAMLTAPATEYQINIETRGVRLSASSEYPVEKLTVLMREAVR
jgi:transposase-like protein